MLTNLCVRHLAVVDDIELTLKPGMTSLTGETGAGKSILVDALGLVLGDRADSNMIRHGHDRAEVEASFDVSQNEQLQQWLIQQELDDQSLCHLRRTISRDGRSRAYINGRTVPLSQLKIISEKSIDIHGQHAHQSLVRPDTQRQLLDTVANTKPLLDALKTSYQQWQSIQQQIDTQTQQAEQYRSQLDLLNYQINELEPLDLSEDSLQKLIHEQQQLANVSQLTTAAQSSLYQLFEQENGAAYHQINLALNELRGLLDIEPRFANLIELLNSITVQLDESETELRHYLDHIDLDPSKLDDIETQLSTLHSLARKHHVEIEALPEHYQSLCDQRSNLNDLDSQIEQLQQQLIQQKQHCLDLCNKITEKRQKSAKPLAKKIMATIQELAIPAGKIEIIVSPMQLQEFNETGADQIQLLVSTNPGQAAGELGKVASGGELARISLAIQVVTAGTRSVPTLVFDEVDVGIGGGIAEIVGQHLRKLAATQQVICITHLPQVAAQAQQQLQVNKKQLSNSTHIEVSLLDEEQRIEEIARMLGGVKLTEKTRLHAQEMLEQTNNSVI